MADPAKVSQQAEKQQTLVKLQKLDSLLQDFVHPSESSWFIRHHVDGSWSVIQESQAANDS